MVRIPNLTVFGYRIDYGPRNDECVCMGGAFVIIFAAAKHLAKQFFYKKKE